MSAVVRTERLSKSYRVGDSAVEALSEVSLAVAPGEFLAITGPSGSGKTTLLQIMGCLERPSAGTLWIGSQNPARLSDGALSDFRARSLGFVFQSFNLMPVLTAGENVELPLLAQGLPRAKRRDAVADALACVGLGRFAAHRPSQMSGGQRQRVAIARAIVGRPALVLADEPTANLDHATAEQVLDLMKSINETRGTTFVFSTHDPRIMSRASRRIELTDGRVGALR